jgi:Effector Associated Constant Component 1
MDDLFDTHTAAVGCARDGAATSGAVACHSPSARRSLEAGRRTIEDDAAMSVPHRQPFGYDRRPPANGEPMADEEEPVRPEAMAEARITVEGQDTDAESLRDWLRHEPELRGRLRTRSVPTPDGAMGAPIELVVVLATATIPVASALARSLSTWLVQRRSDLTVTVTGPDGRQISLSSRRIADPEKLLRAVLEPVLPEPIDGPTPPETGRESDTAGER